MKDATKPTRGGKRDGTGRKPGPFGPTCVVPHRVARKLVDEVRKRARSQGREAHEIHSEALAAGLDATKRK